jgi:hypothetical protein
VATADRIYADPGALLKLYRHEPESRAVAAWRGTIKGPLAVTHHGRVKLSNGIALAAHRGLINERACDAALPALDDDFEQGRYLLAEIPWGAVLGHELVVLQCSFACARTRKRSACPVEARLQSRTQEAGSDGVGRDRAASGSRRAATSAG